MRHTSFAVLLLALAACDGKPITGPEAQRAIAQAKAQYPKLPAGTLVLVDGVLLASDRSVNELDPATIETVEVVKGAAASRLYGPGASNGVIIITTKRK